MGWYASIWPSYQALDALYVTSLLPGGQACSKDFANDVRAIDANYWDASVSRSLPAFDQGPNPFHVQADAPRIDDSLWMALAILSEYSRSRDRVLLERAEAVFRLAIGNWNPRSGGIYWEDHGGGTTDSYESLVSNAPTVVLGVKLFVQTGRRTYLRWSERDFGWLEKHLFNSRTGLFDDGIDESPGAVRVNATMWTYNQGIVLGAMTALSTVNPGTYPRIRALQFAEHALTFFSRHRSYGMPGFDAIWVENLLWTAGVSGDAAFTHAARASLADVRGEEPPAVTDLLDRGSEVALEELAKLPPDEYGELPPEVVGVHNARG